MINTRQSLLNKVRALLAKTLDNGCTEEEASAALGKAQAMIDAYEISESELELTKKEKAILQRMAPDPNDPRGIRDFLCVGVAAFTGTRVWGRKNEINFCGLPADVEFAMWLTDSLKEFVQRELVEYLARERVSNHDKRRHINGFILGATGRIYDRLRALAAERRASPSAAAASTRNALVVIQGAAIREYMAEHRIRLRGGGSVNRVQNSGARAAGHAAGDRASFGRPVGSGTLRLN